MQVLAPEDPRYLGPYRLLGRLGEGGMGLVYLGRSEGGRTVALKVVRAEFAQLAEFRRRFAREVAAARRVGGQWTADVLDADTEAAVPWVATRYIPGPSLYEVVAEGYGALPERSVRVLADRLALALAAVHDAGLIHRDLKPSNVLVTVDGPRVIDFGIARALDALDTATGELAYTRTGMVIGSPGFMSPEQARGRELTVASDVFCLGSVLAYAATGRQPFGATGNGGVHAQLFRVAEDEPDLDGVPESLLPLVRECLHKDPALRPTPRAVAERAALVETGPWLPGEVLEQLGRRAAELLDYDPASAPGHGATPTVRSAQAAQSAPAASATPAAPGIAARQAPPPAAPTMPARPPAAPPPPAAPAPARGAKRSRALAVGAAAVALAVAGAGLLALKPWEEDAGSGGRGGGGSVAVPKQFVGEWEGKLTTKGAAAGEYARLRISGGGERAVEVSVLGRASLCVTTSAAEEAAYDQDSGERTLTLGQAGSKSATPRTASADCWKPARSELGFGPASNDRLTWLVDGQEVQLTKRESPSLDKYQGVWFPETDEAEPGPLEQVGIAGTTVEQSTVRVVDGMGSDPSCHYRAKVFSAPDGLLTTPPELDAVTADMESRCPRSRSPLRLTLVDDGTVEYRSLDSAASGLLTSV
ncbi:serine/threonine protein kinase [Streptomyces sp. NA04227]|nr:serine/threonine-protein kinase [Streptomyces sp. NA04227]QKW11046.1 serine/threonine protein kinase [Streptomyces sp. NA04227]